MGLTNVTVNITNLSKSKKGYESLFLVDTGAIHCMAPASKLEEAGIDIEGKQSYELANGQALEYYYGFARVSFLGSETVSEIIFGPEDAEPILGVLALEGVGICVDPVSRSLKRLPAIHLK